MALTTPDSASEVIDRAVNDVRLSLREFNAKPALKNSWLNALIVAYSNRIFDFYFALDQAALEALPDTAVENLDRWAAIYGVQRIAGVRSTGNVVATGTTGAVILGRSLLESGGNLQYQTRPEDVEIEDKNISITSITRTGSTAEATSAAHGLASNVAVTISGVTEPEYNVSNAEITVIDADTFTYQVSGTPSTPATTAPFSGDFSSAVIIVDSVTFDVGNDQILDAEINFQSPQTGVNEITRVDADGLGGGVTQETDSDLRERLLERIQNPIAHFNVDEITAQAKTVGGVTRVFVEEITPDVGQVTIYFMRDNDTSSIPDGSEVSAVDDAIQEIRPANTSSSDVIVSAPTEVSVDFNFSALSPNTSSMKDAIEESLAEFFAERTTVGQNIQEDAYRSAIFNTVDPTNGDLVESFTLSSPVGDIVIASGEIGTLGSVTFP